MVDSLYCRQPRLLQNVVGIDSPMKARVHAKSHQSPQAIAMLREQFGQRVLVAFCNSTDQFRIRRIICHKKSPVRPFCSPNCDQDRTLAESGIRPSISAEIRRRLRKTAGTEPGTTRHQIPENRYLIRSPDPELSGEAEQIQTTAFAQRKKSPPGVSFVGMLFGNAGLIDFCCRRRILERNPADRVITSCTIQARLL